MNGLSRKEGLMSGQLPIDRARERQDAPKIYDEHRERFAEHEAARREADDPVSGARPPAPEQEEGTEHPEGTEGTEGAEHPEAER
jgi:hypothetical protein